MPPSNNVITSFLSTLIGQPHFGAEAPRNASIVTRCPIPYVGGAAGHETTAVATSASASASDTRGLPPLLPSALNGPWLLSFFRAGRGNLQKDAFGVPKSHRRGTICFDQVHPRFARLRQSSLDHLLRVSLCCLG